MLLMYFFVMNFMCSSDAIHISVVQFSEPAKALVNDYIMYEEIGKAIKSDANANHQPKVIEHDTGDEAIGTGYSKYEKESIVFFKETFMSLMMVTMQIPEETMHHKFVCEPCHKLHEEEGGHNDED